MAELTLPVMPLDAGPSSDSAAPTGATQPIDAPAETTATPIEGSRVNGEAPESKEVDDTTTQSVPLASGTADGDVTTDAVEVDDADLAPDSTSKDKKKKSSSSVPEHKTKKLNKKKSMPTLHLDCKPGDFYWARLKGYPPWPSVVCDEEMLPESLLATRPVSTARPDGSIREDFQPGGKNAKERTFPVMFLATNEFQWMVNTNLAPLEPDECKNPTGKMSKMLLKAYEIAAEGHELNFFKDILTAWQEEEEMLRQREAEAQAEADRLRAEAAERGIQDGKDSQGKSKKKAARKSKGGDDDVEMGDTETPKSSKKRKKDGESDADGSKPKKTPKVTKLNAPKTPNGESSTAKKAAKPKKKIAADDEDQAKPQLTEAEKKQNLEKAILYLRHRLQKGFLSRDQAPQESEMAAMADLFTQLEAYEDLDPAIIRTTKIHKVLKAIVKLASVPKDDEYDFKKRSAATLEVWNKRMEDNGDHGPTSAVDTKPPADETAPGIDGDATSDTAIAAPTIESKDAVLPDVAPTDPKTVEEHAADRADEIEQKLEEKSDAVSAAPGGVGEAATNPTPGHPLDTTAVNVAVPQTSESADP